LRKKANAQGLMLNAWVLSILSNHFQTRRIPLSAFRIQPPFLFLPIPPQQLTSQPINFQLSTNKFSSFDCAQDLKE
jgi:hypothetical protein